jgi:DNA-binding CsgD family transcriptional regulator
MRKMSKIRKELYETNLKLAELNKNTKHINNQLQKVNAQLSEANHIKEEYIAQFFDICSGYINKLEDYRKLLYKKAGNKQHEELFNILKSTTLVDEERGKLYETFDTIFLNLYPSFVENFNSLLPPEEQIVLKPGERLNTELRIFALIRLGIIDSVRIAGFLRYSLGTIYNYRTRIRNNAVVSRDEFEEIVMNIGAIQEKR